MIIKIPALVPFRYPLLSDWLWIFIRHYKVERQVFFNRLTGMIVIEIPALPEQLIQTLKEVGCVVEGQ